MPSKIRRAANAAAPMADGLNPARAVRIHELVSDFRTLQHWFGDIPSNVDSDDENALGYALLRRTVAIAEAVLAQPFDTGAGAPEDEAEQKTQLRRVLRDACVRRFRCQKAQLQALAVRRWIQARQSILQGQQADARHTVALQVLDTNLRTEISALTDERVYMTLRAKDTSEGKWILEDPSLAQIQAIITVSVRTQ